MVCVCGWWRWWCVGVGVGVGGWGGGGGGGMARGGGAWHGGGGGVKRRGGGEARAYTRRAGNGGCDSWGGHRSAAEASAGGSRHGGEHPEHPHRGPRPTHNFLLQKVEQSQSKADHAAQLQRAERGRGRAAIGCCPAQTRADEEGGCGSSRRGVALTAPRVFTPSLTQSTIVPQVDAEEHLQGADSEGDGAVADCRRRRRRWSQDRNGSDRRLFQPLTNVPDSGRAAG